MKSIRKFVLTDGNRFIYDDNDNATVQATTDFEKATDYRFNVLFRKASQQKANNKYNAEFFFKEYIGVSGEIDIDQNIDVGGSDDDGKNSVTMYDWSVYAITIIMTIGVMQEQGFFTGLVLAILVAKIFSKEQS